MTFVTDLRHGVRQLIREPAFSLAAVASLALGIGMTTALFSAVNAVLLRDSAVRQADGLVEIYSGVAAYPQLTTSYPDYLSLRERADVFDGVAAHSFVRAILSSAERPRLVTGETVSANYFDVLRITPALGRSFGADDDQAGSSPVVVISHGLWQRQFGGGSDVLGRTLQLSGREYSIVGVAPRYVRGTVPGIPTDFWVPVSLVDRFEFSGVQWTMDNDPGATRLEQRGARWLFVKGRLAPGRTVEQARSQIAAIFAALRMDHPVLHKNVQPDVVPSAGIRFHPAIDVYVRAGSVVLLTAVGLVLLVACANVANMLLARSTARRRELAIRAALGAGRGSIVRHLLSESVILAGAGGAVGIVIAYWASGMMAALGTNVFPVPVDFDVAVDGTVLVFAIVISLLTAVLFGLAPAWSASKVDLVPALKAAAGDASSRRRWLSARDLLVVGQMALSVVLLVAGSLLVRGLLAARATDIGYDPGPLASLSFNLQMNGYDQARATVLRDRALESIAALPGVAAVSHASRLPLAPDINMQGVKVPGHHSPSDQETPIDSAAVGPDYFRTVGVPIVEGRAFTTDEIRLSSRVAIVNQTMARRYWPNGPAVGRRIHLGDFDEPPHEIVGVARDHAVRSVAESARPYLHLPAGESRAIGLIVRTTAPAASALPMLREALWRLEPNIVFTEDVTGASIAETTMAPTRIGAVVMGAFGALSLALAAVGLYGVIAYSVSLRTREVGIRMAIGAARGRILRMVLAQGGRLAGLGIIVGTLVSIVSGQVLGSLLYGISPFDPVAYGAVYALLLAVAGAANLVPAISAARIDPLRALRRD